MTSKPLILDVRSRLEYQMGHAPGSVNIPVDELAKRLGELERTRNIYACCAGGGRSARAKEILETEGFMKVLNAGAWQNAELLASVHMDEDPAVSF